MNIREYICQILNCNENCSQALENCNLAKAALQNDLYCAELRIKHLENLLNHPAPPKLDYLVEKDTAWIQAVIAKYEPSIIRLPLGPEVALTDKTNFMEFVAWDWVDKFDYHKFYRCGNFAISFKAHADQFGINQVGIVIDYQAGHAYNLVIFPDKKVMLLEPQSDNIWYAEDKDLPFYVLKGAFVII